MTLILASWRLQCFARQMACARATKSALARILWLFKLHALSVVTLVPPALSCVRAAAAAAVAADQRALWRWRGVAVHWHPVWQHHGRLCTAKQVRERMWALWYNVGCSFTCQYVALLRSMLPPQVQLATPQPLDFTPCVCVCRVTISTCPFAAMHCHTPQVQLRDPASFRGQLHRPGQAPAIGHVTHHRQPQAQRAAAGGGRSQWRAADCQRHTADACTVSNGTPVWVFGSLVIRRTCCSVSARPWAFVRLFIRDCWMPWPIRMRAASSVSDTVMKACCRSFARPRGGVDCQRHSTDAGAVRRTSPRAVCCTTPVLCCALLCCCRLPLEGADVAHAVSAPRLHDQLLPQSNAYYENYTCECGCCCGCCCGSACCLSLTLLVMHSAPDF